MDLGLLVTIFLAVSGGLFYIANQFPKFYEEVWGYCLGFCLVVVFSILGYQRGIVAARSKISEDWDVGRPDTTPLGEGITFALKSISEMDDLKTIAIAAALLAGFVMFFRILPRLKEQERDD